MLKVKVKQILKKLLIQLLYSFIFLGIGYVIAILISHRFNLKLQDVMSYEGFIFILIGALLSPKGNHSGINLQGAGQRNSNLVSYQDLEVTRLEQELERESSNYYKNFFKHNAVYFTCSNITFILVGIFIITYSLYYL